MVARFSPTTPLILLCDVGVVSRIAAMRLLERAFASVRVVAGGFEAWSLEAERPGAHLTIESGRPANADWPTEQGVAPTPSWEGSWDEEDEYAAARPRWPPPPALTHQPFQTPLSMAELAWPSWHGR